jgi:uncharacterized damage-inducible protein DinB
MYSWKNHFVVLADYQVWANEVLFGSLERLGDSARKANEGLYFGSMHHTMDHILATNRLWAARLRGETASVDSRKVQCEEWRNLKISMQTEARALQRWLDAKEDAWFDSRLAFASSDGKPREMWVRDALTHVFNHATHHRGQVSAVATRLGAPCPQMDYVYYKREMEGHLAEFRNR